MKRFKKVLALVLAGVLALAMLTACDGGTTDSDKIMQKWASCGRDTGRRP